MAASEYIQETPPPNTDILLALGKLGKALSNNDEMKFHPQLAKFFEEKTQDEPVIYTQDGKVYRA